MFCTHCGARIDDDAKFCIHCGEPTGAPEDDGLPTIDGVPVGGSDVTTSLASASPAANPQPVQAPAPVPSPAQYAEREQAGAKKGCLSTGAKAGIAVAVAAVLAIGGVALFTKMSGDAAAQQAAAEAAEQQAVADAAKKLTVAVSGSDATAFPTVTASIKVVDGNGDGATDLAVSDVKLTEKCSDGSTKDVTVTNLVSNGGGVYQLSFTAQDSKDDAENRSATIACISANYEWSEVGFSYTAPAKEKKTDTSTTETKQTAPTQVLVVTTDKSADYMLPSSNCAYYSESDISGLSDWELYLARNEIYARHGRGFNNADLQRYFNGKSWYRMTVSPESFNENVLNKYEKANASMILAHEKSIGSQYI